MKQNNPFFEKTLEAERILGLPVISKTSKSIGKVGSISINTKTLIVEGIIVDRGLFRVDYYLDKSYIKYIDEAGVHLKTSPDIKIIGLDVYDSKGDLVSKVKSVKRSKKHQRIISITLNNDLIITSDYIKAIGDAVMLKVEMDREYDE